VHLACCDDGGVRVVLAVVGEEWVRLDLAVQPNGAVAATLTAAGSPFDASSSSSSCNSDPAVRPAAEEPAAAIEQQSDNQEVVDPAALLRQQHSVLLQENGRLQCLVRQVRCLPAVQCKPAACPLGNTTAGSWQLESVLKNTRTHTQFK
jgi:hypothetical protein